MTMPAHFGAREGGMVTAFVTGVVFALLVATGLVYDGGNVLARRREADNTAASAARAAAQALDVEALYRGEPIRLDVAEAEAIARRVAGDAGAETVEVTVTGDRVDVTIGMAQDLSILGAGGVVGPVEVHGRATARLAYDVGGPP